MKSDQFSQSATQEIIGMKVYTEGQLQFGPNFWESMNEERYRQRMFERLVLK